MLAIDFGDAPDTGAGASPGNYNTLLSDNGAQHTIVSGLFMGTRVDGEAQAIPNSRANGDDTNQGPDDEDGLVSPELELRLTQGGRPVIHVRATNTTGSSGTIFGWIDYNANGAFENVTERTSVPVPNGMSNGIFTLTFPDIPAGFTGQTFARFRLSTDLAASSPTGAATNGEVEDYQVTISRPTDGTIVGFQKLASQNVGTVMTGLADVDRFGSSVVSLGDLDGDGVADLAVGAYLDDTGGTNRGAAYVLFMNANGTAKASPKIASSSNGGPTLADNDGFGFSLASLGDLDGDGVTDLAVGALNDDAGGNNRGAVYILFLNSNGTVKSRTKIDSGSLTGSTLADGDSFGRSLASLGDLDGDGVMDLAVGAYADSSGGPGRGAVYVLRLNADGTVKGSNMIASGTPNGPVLADEDDFGTSLASLGDINGDGLPDLAVGAMLDDTGGTNRGAVHVVRLNSNGTPQSIIKIASGSGGLHDSAVANFERFGSALASVGDLDGDGVNDLAVGAHRDGGLDRGAVHLLLLTYTGTVKSSSKIADGTVGGPALAIADRFGTSVAALGDLNHDGVVDLAVGANLDDTLGADRGAVYVLNLDATGKAPTIVNTWPSLAGGTLPAGTTSLQVTFSEPAVGVLVPNLVSLWAGNGTATDDIAGNRGTFMNGTTFVSGKVGQAFSFDGVDDYVQVGAPSNLRFTGAFSIEGWVKAGQQTSSGGKVFINKEGEYEFGISETGTLWYALANTSPGWVVTDTGIPLPLNEWHHVALTHGNNAIRVFLDGNLVSTSVASGAVGDIAPGLDDFRIGSRQGSTTEAFKGQIDELGVYNRALSQAEVQALFNSGNAGQPRNTAANFELRRAGANGLLGELTNNDDIIVPLTGLYSSAGNTATLTFAALPEDVYRLTVKDTITDAAGNALDGNADGAPGGYWMRDFVVTATAVSTSPYRWATFNTFDNATSGWLMGNNASLYGGVQPSNWTDGSAPANQMSTDLSVLAALFTNKGSAGPNGMIYSGIDTQYSSTNGRIVATLFRVQNATNTPLTWTPSFYYSQYNVVGERASIAVNGSLIWTGNDGLNSATVSIPLAANSTSSIVFISTNGPYVPIGSGLNVRANQFGFSNNSLSLTSGLAFIDDLPTTNPYRWTTFNTFDNATNAWLLGNNASIYGGVQPTNWTDGSATANEMSTDLSVLAALFTNKGSAGPNAMIYSGTDSLYSSTNGRIVATLFRVQNATNAPLTWTPSFYYSQNNGFAERASIAVNGSLIWTGNDGLNQATVPISLPANTISTVIFISTDGPRLLTGPGLNVRGNQFGFIDNSLSLTSGLRFIDDLPATNPYRWTTFNTFDNATSGWLMGNNASMYGGVNPSNWTDGTATANEMSTDLSVLAALFTNKGSAGPNAMIYSGTDTQYSTTNGRIVATLFRVQNTTDAPLSWTPSFYYSQYNGLSERASIAVNGSLIWTGNDGLNQATVSIPLAAHSTSTVIFVSTNGYARFIDSYVLERANQFGFFNNSLSLESGLSFVDDLSGPPAVISLNSQSGFQFDINPRNAGAGELVQGTNNAFDGLNRLKISGLDFSATSPTLDDSNRTVVTGNQTFAGLLVRREITVPSTGTQDFARTVEVFMNSSGSTITVPVEIVGNLGSDLATTVFATSDGDTTPESTDQWIGTDDADGSGTPAIVHYLHGPFGLKPTSISVSGDNIQWTYTLTVPAGQTVRLAHYTILNSTRAGAVAAANALVGNAAFSGQAAAFLSQSELDSLANFEFNRTPIDTFLTNIVVSENSADGEVIGTFSTVDANAGDTHTYSLVDDAGGRFGISGNQLVVADGSRLDYEAQRYHEIILRSTDLGGLSVDNIYPIIVNNVNETPTIDAQVFTLQENMANGAVVGVVMASDPDAWQPLTYAIVGGNGNPSLGLSNVFAIDPSSGEITVTNAAAVDFETNPVFNLMVRVTDNGAPELASMATVTINLTDVALQIQSFVLHWGAVGQYDLVADPLSLGSRALPWMDIKSIDLIFSDNLYDLTGTLRNNTSGTTNPLFSLAHAFNSRVATVNINSSTRLSRGNFDLSLTDGVFGSSFFSKNFRVLAGDFDGNGVVNVLDANSIKNLWLAGTLHVLGDLNGDGFVDGADYTLARQKNNTRLP